MVCVRFCSLLQSQCSMGNEKIKPLSELEILAAGVSKGVTHTDEERVQSS